MGAWSSVPPRQLVCDWETVICTDLRVKGTGARYGLCSLQAEVVQGGASCSCCCLCFISTLRGALGPAVEWA